MLNVDQDSGFSMTDHDHRAAYVRLYIQHSGTPCPYGFRRNLEGWVNLDRTLGDLLRDPTNLFPTDEQNQIVTNGIHRLGK
jgi:hypothetical protein